WVAVPSGSQNAACLGTEAPWKSTAVEIAPRDHKGSGYGSACKAEDRRPAEFVTRAERPFHVVPRQYREDDGGKNEGGSFNGRERAHRPISREDKERPVPEIERVRDQSDEHDGRGAEELRADALAIGIRVNKQCSA